MHIFFCGKKIKDVLKAKLDKTQHANLFNKTILPRMFYSSKTWATMKKVEQLLVTTQTTMEWSMLRRSFHKHIQSEVIWKQTSVKYLIAMYQKQRFHWAGHVARFTDNKWYPRDQK